MFYVSSIKKNKYGITDTKDGVEEFYNKKEIKQFINAGIEIDGVFCPKSENIEIMVSSYMGGKVLPKDKLLRGYSYTVKDDVLTNISFSEFKDEIVVTLSSICKALAGNSVYKADNVKVTLIFDDDILGVDKEAFRGLHGHWNRYSQISMDVTRVTRIDLLLQVYWAVSEVVLIHSPNLVDNQDRYDKLFQTVYLFRQDPFNSTSELPTSISSFVIENCEKFVDVFIPNPENISIRRLERVIDSDESRLELVHALGIFKTGIYSYNPIYILRRAMSVFKIYGVKRDEVKALSALIIRCQDEPLKNKCFKFLSDARKKIDSVAVDYPEFYERLQSEYVVRK